MLILLLVRQAWAEDNRKDSLTYVKTNTVDYAEKFSDFPNASVEDALTGRIAGVLVKKWSGSPGVQSLVSIRNAGSLNGTNMPLIILNGLPIFHDQTIYTEIDPLSTIPIEEISSVEVLKDANAIALYGSRGANGVIIITTKKGADKDALYVNVAAGVNFVGNNLESPISGNTERTRLKMLYDKRNSLYPHSKVAYPAMVSDTQNSFFRESNDWQKNTFDVRPVIASDITLSGSGDFGFYRLNIGAMSDQGVKKDNGFSRYNLGLNTRYNITKSFSFDFYISAVLADRSQSLSNLFEPSYYPYNDDTNFFPELTFESDNSLLNDNKNKHIVVNSSLNFILSESLKLTSLFGIVSETYKSKLFIPSTLNNGSISAFAAAAKRHSLSNKTVATWTKDWTVTNFGIEFISTNNELVDIKGERSGSGFSDFVKTVGSAYSRADVIGQSDDYTNVLFSAFVDSRIDLSKKLELLLTLRVDGLSSFENNRWDYFPALGGKWKIVEGEKQKGITYLALKANAGKSGYTSNPDNLFMGSALSQGNYLNQEGPVAIYNSNEDLAYPVSTQFDLGADFKFGQKTTLSVDWFSKTTKDHMYQVVMPSYSGYSLRYANGFDVKHSGFEFTLNSKILEGNFSWDFGVNAAAISSEVRELPADASNSALSFIKEGNSLTSIYAYEANGYYADEVGLSNGFGKIAFQQGTPKIIDKNSDGKITEADMVKIADSQPTLFGGISNLFSVGKLYLDTHFSFGLGGEIVTESHVERFADDSYLHSLLEDNGELTKNYFMRSEGSGNDNLVIQGISGVEKASYLRLEKVSLGYDLGAVKFVGLNFKGAKMFITGTNLLLLTNYDGDPQGSLNDVKQFDLATSGTPRYRTIMLGLRIKL